MNRTCLAVLCLAFALVSCGTDDAESYIKLSEPSIEADYSGVSTRIYVDSNCEWSVSEAPEWFSIEPKNDAEGPYLTVTILPNPRYDARSAAISVYGGGVSADLSITQSGITNSSSLEWHAFPVNSFAEVSSQGGTEEYRITGTELFINAAIKDRIFHGHLIPSYLGDISDPDTDGQYTYNPITISCIANGQAYVREQQIPSIAATSDLAEEVITAVGDQNTTFTYSDTPIQYNSYRHLNLLGVGNLGLKLDELITGLSHEEAELGNRTGLIYSYCQELFTTTMDIPENLIQESLSDTEKEELSYVSNISYGRTALLVVETEYSYEVSSIAIKGYMQGADLEAEEEDVVDTADVWYVSFDGDGEAHIEAGGKALMMKYVNNIGSGEIIPLNFSLNNYSDNTSGRFSFSLTL